MPIGLRAKIILITTCAMLFAMGSVIGVGSYVFYREYTTALQSRSIAIATGLKVQLERVLQLGIPLENLVGFEEQAQEAVKAYEGIEYAMVVAPDGRILFHSNPSRQGRTVDEPEILGAVRGGTQTTTVHRHPGTGDWVYGAVVPVFDALGAHQASIVIDFPAALITGKATEMARLDLGVGLTFLLIATLALMAALSVLVTTPLGRLIDAMQGIRERSADLTHRVAVSSTDEIGRLAGTFNDLMSELQTTTVSKERLEDAMAALQDSEERYRRVVESSPSAIFVDRGNRLVFANPAGARLLGATDSDQMYDRSLLEFVHPDSRDAMKEKLRQLSQGARTIELSDVRIRRLDGTLLDVEITGIAFAFGGTSAMQVVVQDVTEAKRKAAELAYAATHDALTGLPNRVLMRDRLNAAMAYARRYGRHATVVFLDLDHFKVINDSLGHEQGDILLKTIADRLSSSCVREVDTVARIGGDEFVVVLFDQPEDGKAIYPSLERIQVAIKQPITLPDGQYNISSSMGFAVFPEDGTDVETLIANADAAMYRAKELGRNNFQAFSEEMHTRLVERLGLHNGLRRAIEREEFLVYYQPQADLRSGEIVGAEALVRWLHPDHGLLSPDRFIPLAEETGLITSIGETVLRVACAQARAWQAMRLPAFRIAVNLSPRQFWQPDLVPMVERFLRDTGLDPTRLELELTETLVMRSVEEAVRTMKALQAMGVGLAMDDFGTGYSSLSALKRFPLNRIKIAQVFMRDVPIDADSVAIAEMVIALGHHLKLKVIAEGVETPEQLRFLQAHDCDEIQGYLLGKPMPPEEMTEMLARVPDLAIEQSHVGSCP